MLKSGQEEKKCQQMQQALRAIDKGMSFRVAAAKYGCCKSTLHKIVKKNKRLEAESKQETETLSRSQEERLGNWLVHCYYMGYFKVAHTDLSREAGYFVKLQKSKLTFDRKWSTEFQQRLVYVKKCLESYENYRELNSNLGNKWLGSLIIYCRNLNLFHCLQDPRHMYYLCQLRITGGLNMIMAYSAQGQTAPPLIINVSSNRIVEFEQLKLPPGWFSYNCREMPANRHQANPLIYYIEQILKPYLMQEEIKNPILLFHRYQDYPLSLPYYELCTEHQIYPVNSLLTAFKLDHHLELDIFIRMKTVPDKQLASYVDLLKNILIFKLTKQKISESFRESGIYPLALGRIDIEELPRLQMIAQVESGENTAQPHATKAEFNNDTAENSILCENVDSADASAAAPKLTPNVLIENPGSLKISNIVTLPEKRPSSISLHVDNYDHMAFQNFCLDDDDVVVSNEPLQTDDTLRC